MNPQNLLSVLTTQAPMFSPEADTFLNMLPNLLSVALLAAIMTYLLYNPIKKILADRAEKIAGELKDAEDKNLTASELKIKYEQKVKDIELERSEIIDAARKEAKDRQIIMLDEAKAEAASVKERAARDIAAEQVRFKDSVHAAIIDISTDMAAKLISATIDKDAHSRLFDEAMAELESTVFKVDPATV